ncbi:hypothetical protein BDW67DRAFT_142298 [Aspergillus spinulosporus]
MKQVNCCRRVFLAAASISVISSPSTCPSNGLLPVMCIRGAYGVHTESIRSPYGVYPLLRLLNRYCLLAGSSARSCGEILQTLPISRAWNYVQPQVIPFGHLHEFLNNKPWIFESALPAWFI